MKTYIVTWDTYRNRVHTEWQKEVVAENAKLAREHFDHWWFVDHEGCTFIDGRLCLGESRVSHPFHVKVRLKKA